MLPLVVVTGAFGRVGAIVRPALRGQYRLRLVDRVSGPTAAGEEAVVADLADPDTGGRVLAGASALIHLAADGSPFAGWERAFAANVAPLRPLLDAAAAHRVPKLVLASSVHTMGGYNRPAHHPVDPAWSPRPCCDYGRSKVLVETMGALHAGRTGASVISLRLGLTGWPLDQVRYAGMWLSDRDAGSLFLGALRARIGHGAYFGVSANTRRHWDLTSARADLGYDPRDDSEPLTASAGPPLDYVCGLFGPAENP